MSVLLETSAGDLVIDLLTVEAPKTCLNFLKLCKAKYYNFTPIYNLQTPSFFQTGDPAYPDGDGGTACWGLSDPSKRFFRAESTRRIHERGSISMVSSAQGLCGSQFFISLGPNESFDKKHVIFGRLAEGFETLDAIAAQPVDGEYRPLRDIRIKHTIILEDPFDDPPDFIGEPPESPLPTPAQLSTVRIAFDEDVEHVGDEDQVDAQRRAREADASALALEAMGDLPFASVRPPENILFVCKLNPVTSSDDLSIIFGRFGKILSCQIVRDAKTGDSLQYAFIEFDVKDDAERAYFKMQGVLIDDRRIHVDFSQSVARAHTNGRSGRERQSNGRQRSRDRSTGTSRSRDYKTSTHSSRRDRDVDSRDRNHHRSRRRSYSRERHGHRDGDRYRDSRRDRDRRSRSRDRRR